jgi:hypothetical protein
VTRLARVFAAVVFALSLAGLVQAFPVPQDQESPSSAGPESSPTDDANDEGGLPGSEPSPGSSPAPDAPIASALLPPSCSPAPAKVESALAIASEGEVRLFTTAGTALGEFPGSGSPRWSVSGRYVGTDDAVSYSRSGERLLRLFPDRVKSWVWSPTSDCAFGVGKDGLFVGHPDGSRILLHGDSSQQVAASPDGRAVVTAANDGRRTTFRLTDLRRGKARRYALRTRGVLAGWLGRAPLVRTKKDLFVLRGAGAKRVGRLSVDAGPIFPCHEGPVAAADGDLISIPSGSVLASGFEEAACEPGGGFIVAIASGSGDDRALTALDSDGSAVAPLTASDDGMADAYPLWGDQGQGVLFWRRASSGGDWELWRVPEGGRPAETGVSFSGSGPGCWGRLIGWSAVTPPGYDICESVSH